MEFLIGRSLANNVTNLMLSPIADEVVRQKHLDWIDLLEQEPDAALGNGGLGRLAACFLGDLGYVPLPYVAASGSGVRRGEKKRLKDKSAHPFPERQFAFPLLIFLRRA